jgi:hypothetical protein
MEGAVVPACLAACRLLRKGDPLNINVDIEDINIDKIGAEVSFLCLSIALNTCMLFRNFQILDRLHSCPVFSDPSNEIPDKQDSHE